MTSLHFKRQLSSSSPPSDSSAPPSSSEPPPSSSNPPPTSDTPMSSSQPPSSPPSSNPPTSTPPTSTPPTSTPPTSTPPTSTPPTSTPPTSTPPTSTPPTSTPPSSTPPTSTPPTSTPPTSTPPTSTPPTSTPPSSTPPDSTSSESSTQREAASSSPPTSSLPRASTTFGSTVFETTTNSLGQTVSTAPPEITSTFASTQSDGAVTTVTQVIANPTLNPNNQDHSGSQFFRNKGAVAGVFLIVGLAGASIILFLFFFLRRRRRTRMIEHDTTVSAAVAAAGLNRAPIDDDDDDVGGGVLGRPNFSTTPDMAERSALNSTSTSRNNLPTDDELGITGGFDPYAEYGHPAGAGPSSQGYSRAANASPPPPGAYSPHHSLQGSANSAATGLDRRGHVPHYSAGSYEPLLANFSEQPSPSPTTPGDEIGVALGGPPQPPPRNPLRALDQSPKPAPVDDESVYETDDGDGAADARLNPKMERISAGPNRSQSLRDDVDYSRPVLAVRNASDLSKN
ncbi:hypothetical protein DENSPDRAFT_837515 [Dentipellis sp. KUC8613]|nr:hypothetical protein DENSPDRAFT_837515 [Dentipellis sp. KUC8613]